MKKSAPAESVDRYLAGLPDGVGVVLKKQEDPCPVCRIDTF
jgi:hypothetical protein